MQGISSTQGVSSPLPAAAAASASAPGLAGSSSGAAAATDGSGVGGAASAAGRETSAMTMTLVTDRVSSFLSNFGGVVGGNDLLRMVIAMLILDALAGDKKDDDGQRSPLAGLLALSLGQTQTSSTLSHFSSSYSTDAVQGASDARAGAGAGAYQSPPPTTSTINMMG